MARAPELDENVLGGSILDYWPAMYGERGLEVDPPAAEPRRARARRLPRVRAPRTAAQRGAGALFAQAPAGLQRLARGGASSRGPGRPGQVMALASWKSYRERFMALGVIEGGGGEVRPPFVRRRGGRGRAWE